MEMSQSISGAEEIHKEKGTHWVSWWVRSGIPCAEEL